MMVKGSIHQEILYVNNNKDSKCLQKNIFFLNMGRFTNMHVILVQGPC